MNVSLKQFKVFPADSGEDRRHFGERSHIEALEREIAARIEANHQRAGRW